MVKNLIDLEDEKVEDNSRNWTTFLFYINGNCNRNGVILDSFKKGKFPIQNEAKKKINFVMDLCQVTFKRRSLPSRAALNTTLFCSIIRSQQFLCLLLLVVLLMLAKFYAIFSDPTIFFCFTVETGAMKFGKLVWGRVQSQPHMDTDVVVEPRRHVKKQNNGGSECSLTFTVSLRRIQS